MSIFENPCHEQASILQGSKRKKILHDIYSKKKLGLFFYHSFQCLGIRFFAFFIKQLQ